MIEPPSDFNHDQVRDQLPLQGREQDYLQLADRYYVLATSIHTDLDSRILKEGETFAIFDPYGDIQPITHRESGIFHRGTRYVSKFDFLMNGDLKPLLLNSTLRDDSGLLKVDMTNRDISLSGIGFIPKGTLHFQREKFLLEGTCFEKITMANFGRFAFGAELLFRISADFADVFEVRGIKRKRRGRVIYDQQSSDRLVLTYDGLDDIRRSTSLSISGGEIECRGSGLGMKVRIRAGETVAVESRISFLEEGERSEGYGFAKAMDKCQASHFEGRKNYARVRSSSEDLDAWVRRSVDDLVMMTTQMKQGDDYPYAGIPWFCAPFGRDGIITALEVLWVNPHLAASVLRFLAVHQAQSASEESDATPGKIIHEMRDGEMANLNEVPFGKYYGSVDSTPLFLCLAGQYFKRTGDKNLIEEIWPNILAAVRWLEEFSDLDGDGFVEYQRKNPSGLIHQGWKDSTDSVFHENGHDAEGPIALCEVQGYVYMAKVEVALLAEMVGESKLAMRMKAAAEDLKEKFDQVFWLEDLGTFALALDGNKQPCRVSSSNAGQCLFTGIVNEVRATRLVKNLMSEDSFNGWGIRTIAARTNRYNPMSYHNGSVWPHDVALIAWGMSKYGFTEDAERLFNAMFAAANYMELSRLPEVFCGFPRRRGEGPTLYPHACSPQAWASGSVFLFLQAMLGIEIDAREMHLRFRYPKLPASIESLRLTDIKIGSSRVDAVIQNYHHDVSVQLEKREGVTVTVVK